MKKFLLLIAIVFVMHMNIHAVNITFRVDMSNETVLNNDVQVVIKNPWIWTALADQGNGIWEATVTVDANATYPYTFVNGGQDNWDGEEKIEGDCNLGSDTSPERQVEVGESDIILDIYAFGTCDIIEVATTVNVTFRVDMSSETVLNNDVQVVIKNPWIWTALADQGNGIWEASVALEPNASYPYTFVNGGQDNWDGEEKVEGDCNFGSETAPERQIEVGSENITLDLVAFGGCDVIATNISKIETSWEIYPNPTSEYIFIKSAGSSINSINVYDNNGRVILSKNEIEETDIRINMSGFETGTYLVVINQNTNAICKRILVGN